MEEASASITSSLWAPFYHTNPQPITVVLFDDASLRELDLRWPPPYSVTVALLRKVLCARPRAVFVDLLFTHQPETSSPAALQNLMAHLSGERGCRTDAPIFIADMADQKDLEVPGNSVVLEALRTGSVQRVPVNWMAPLGVYPLILEALDTSTWPTALDGSFLPTPAFALYRTAVSGARAEDFVDPMVVRWGLTPQDPPEVPIRLDGTCVRSGPDNVSRSFEALKQVFLDLLFDEPGIPRQTCPYSFFLRAHTVLTESASREGTPLYSAFNDRYVLIGTHLDGIGDTIESPIHGELPRVFLDAMALDNLFLFHTSYWRSLEYEKLVEVFLLWLVLYFHLKYHRKARHYLRMKGWNAQADRLADAELLGVLLFVLVVALTFASFRYSINWLGMWALIGIAWVWITDDFASPDVRKPAGGSHLVKSGLEAFLR